MVNSSTNHENEPNAGYDTNSEGKGWHSDTPSNSKGYTTGFYSVNNIYDMAGTVREWTTEKCKDNGTSYFVVRGGSFNHSGLNNPAADRAYGNGDGFNHFGFRVVLYKQP